MAEAFFTEGECKKRRLPPGLFVPDPETPNFEDTVRAAKDVCRECPFSVECFLYAVQNKETGVWGGAHFDVPPEEYSKDFI